MDRSLILPLVVVTLGALLPALAWHLGLLGLGADFVIGRRRGGRVVIRGHIPRARYAEIREFFGRDLTTAGTLTILGTWSPGGALRLRGLGRLTPGERQQVRNFLRECLG
jgi:hypothetical protein